MVCNLVPLTSICIAVLVAVHLYPVVESSSEQVEIDAASAEVVASPEARHCRASSHRFSRLSDDEQRALAAHSREKITGKQRVLVIGGFGGSGTRAWASLFYSLAPDIQFARGNGDWDAGYAMSNFREVFPVCKESIRDYFDYDFVHSHMVKQNRGRYFIDQGLPKIAGNWNITLGVDQPVWGFKQPDTIASLPYFTTHTDHVVSIAVSRDPRDLGTRPVLHSTPDGSHFGSHDELCGKHYKHLNCDWHMIPIQKLDRETRKAIMLKDQTKECVLHLVDSWAIMYGFIMRLAERHCTDPSNAVQQLFIGRSEDLVLVEHRDKVVGFVQHVLASLGIAKSSTEIEDAINNNDSHHRKKRHGVTKKKKSYGRWKKTTNVFDHSALFPETRQIMQELGYDIAPAALEVDTSTTN